MFSRILRSLFPPRVSPIRQDLNKKQLFCDIDSTVNNHWVRILRWSTGEIPNRRISIEAFSPEEIGKDEVAFDSNTWLQKFKEKGWEIHWLSARPQNLYESTYNWLTTHHFPVDSLTLVDRAASKLAVLKKHKVDLYVDDLCYDQENEALKLYVEVIDSVKASGINLEVFEKNWEDIYNKNNNL